MSFDCSFRNREPILVVIYKATWCTLRPQASKFFLEKKFLYCFPRKTRSEKICYISGNRSFQPQAQKVSYISGNGTFYIFSKKALLIFRETELFKITSYIEGGNFQSVKNKNTLL